MFLIIELLHANNLSYLISLFFFLAIILIFILFYLNYDLFACFILSIYSSVFFLISLFFIYFNKYWTLTWNYFLHFYFFFIFIFLIFLFSFNLYSVDGFTYFFSKLVYNNYLWIMRLNFYDLYVLYFSIYDNLIFFLHLFFYKIFLFASILINIYFFFGIILSIMFLLVIKSWSNSNYLIKFLILKKNFKWLFFPKHLKLIVINKFKRQVRRQNSSIIKYNKKNVFIWYKNYLN